MHSRVMVVGSAGSTPRIALDIAALCGIPVVGVVTVAAPNPFVTELPVLGDERMLEDPQLLRGHVFVNGVHGRERTVIAERMLTAGARLETLIHPGAMVAASASVGAGSMISAAAVVNVDARLGHSCMIHSGATVDHDDVLDDGVTISPGAHLAGHVTVHGGAFIGIGAAVVGGVTIGRNATVGAGAVVIRDVPEGTTVVGNPARVLAR
jgi:sugar O-acyltransferase (sialic acid O-acetyltransferase NeuD family)